MEGTRGKAGWSVWRNMAAKDADVGLENSVEIAIPNAPVESRNAKVAAVIHKSFVKENVSLINAKTSIRRIVRMLCKAQYAIVDV